MSSSLFEKRYVCLLYMESSIPKSTKDENIQLQPSTIPPGNLDTKRPYFVYVQDQTNNSTRVIVFSKGVQIKLDQVDAAISPIYSSMEIHQDDSIHVIKKKILRELHLNQIDAVYDEMYLYAYTKQIHTLNSLFLSILDTGNDSISRKTMIDLAARMNIELGSAGSTMSDKIQFEEFQKIMAATGQDIYMKSALGIMFDSDDASAGFEPDPFLYTTMTMQQREKIENKMKMMDNSLLLNSNKIADNRIYLCLASVVLSTFEKEEDQQHAISVYYKYLYHRSIRTKTQLGQQYGELKKETDKMMDPKMFQIYDSVQLLYDIYQNKTRELEYEERGIKNLTFRIKSNYNVVLPLELVFRNIHASKMIPFIKFNPGNRRENLYRLYYEHLSKTGKKIPYLDAKTIMRLSRDMGKLKQIAIYTEQYIDGVKYPFQLNIESGGGLVVVCDFASSMSAKTKESISAILTQNINPVIDQLNEFLKQTGFSIERIVSLEQMSIEILDMQWYARIVQSGDLKLKTLNCMRAVFEIDETSAGAVAQTNMENVAMNYIRVENYVEMSREDAYISKRYRSDLDIEAIPDIIHGLETQFGFSLEDAKTKMVDYLNMHGYISGTITENAGFTASLRVLKQIRNSFEFKVENITSIHYLTCIEIYVDSIIRLIQDLKSTGIDKSVIDQKCKISKTVFDKARKTEMGEVQKRSEVVDEGEGVKKRPRPIQLVGSELLNFNFDENSGDIVENLRDVVGDVAATVGLEETDEDELLLADEDDLLLEDDEPEIENSIVGDDVDIVDEMVDTKVPMGRERSLSVDSVGSTGTEQGLFYESSPDSINNKPADSTFSQSTKINMGYSMMEEGYSGVDAKSDVSETSDMLMLDESSPESEGYHGFTDMNEDLDSVKLNEEKNINNMNTSGVDEVVGGEDTPEKFKANPTGMALHPSPFLKRMIARDSAIFKINNKSDTEYVRKCQPIGRYPVSITKEEKERIDRENPGSYSSVLEYGSSEDKKNYYICPRFWCFLTDTSITEEDVKAGKCGKIIPDKVPGNKIPDGHYVYEFKRKNPYDKEGNYVHHRPGLFEIEGRKHKLPCCYKTGNVEKQLEKAAVKEPAGEGRQANYIIKMESYPVEKERWGYLPITAQFFLNVNYNDAIDKHNPSYILPGAPVLLRYGIEKNETQSFLALMAEIVAYKQGLAKTPSIAQFKEILLREISLDVFVKIHNASLITSFQPDMVGDTPVEEYARLKETSQFLAAIDERNEKQKTFANNAIAAYFNFQNYIKNDSIEIDHSYLWSIITSDIPSLVKGGLNLILLNRVENDITPHIGLVCPTILSTKQLYDPNKESILVLKQDSFYEPVYLYELAEAGKPVVRKTFSDKTMNQNIRHVLENVKNVSNRYCAPIPSLPRIYEFTTPMRVDEIIDECANIGLKCVEQIMNFQGKIIGVIMQGGGVAATFVPCYPAMPLSGIPTKYMDSLDIWSDYETTKTALTKINNDTGRKVKCAIRLKVVDGGLIVGFLTETNQFVQINPPSENIHGDDGIETYENPDLNLVDSEITTTKGEDADRIARIKTIELETEFYYRFKSLTRELINDYRNYNAKQEIMNLVQPDNVDELAKTTHSEKIKRVETILRAIVEPRVRFEEIDDSVLTDFNSIQCQEKDNRQFCLTATNETASKMILPKWHLYAAESRSLDNSKIYFSRMADELVRNDRSRLFMMNQKKYLNVKNLNYLVNPDEFIIIQSALTGDYLKNLDLAFARNEYLRNVNYDNAHPAITQPYTNQVRLDEQIVAKAEAEKRIMKYEVRDVIGNDRVIWKRIFKNKYNEHVYGEDPTGAYNLMIRVFEESMIGKGIPEIGLGSGEKLNMYHIKQLLWNAYSKHIGEDGDSSKKLFLILSKQGKSGLMSAAINGKTEFNELIFSEKYTLSDLDIWVLASTYGLPIIMFNPNGLKGYTFSGSGNKKITWIKMGGKLNDAFFFIRSLLDSTINKVSAYNLISPTCKLSEVGEFNDVIGMAIGGDTEYKYNILPFSKLLE